MRMMKVLVFAPHAYPDTPFDQWLGELDIEYFLLAPRRTRKSYAGFKNFFPFPRYWSNQNVEVTALELAREHKFDAVLAKDEWDILRSARIRERARIPGQDLASATAYRDKLVMKRLLRAGGVAVAEFAPFGHAFDAVEFTRARGFPVVVKPVAGVAGAHTRVLRDEEALREYLTEGVPPGMMIESFVAGALHHIDGLRDADGIRFACASRYVNSCLSFQTDEYSGSVRLAAGDPLEARLVKFSEKILAALPPVHGEKLHAFHAEVFVTPDDRLVACEIACRTGGGRIVEQTEMEFGLNLDREWWRAELGLKPSAPRPPAHGRRFGHMFIPHQGVGTVTRLPALGKFPWARAEKSFVKVGETLEAEEGRRQNLASCILEGADDAQLEDRMREWNDWFRKETVIE